MSVGGGGGGGGGVGGGGGGGCEAPVGGGTFSFRWRPLGWIPLRIKCGGGGVLGPL